MKTKIALILCVICMTLFSFISIDQDLKTASVTYDGFEYEMYSFIIEGDDNTADIIIAFNDVPEDILEAFDLKSNNLVGEIFEISYEVIIDAPPVDEEELPDESYVLKSIKRLQE